LTFVFNGVIIVFAKYKATKANQMAKLDYTKIKKHGKAYGTGKVLGTDTTWTLTGKYQWQSIRDLPTHYIIWISENFQADNKHKIKADRELQRRYYRQLNGVKERPVRDSI
jgi:hypothetical protein